MAKRAWVFLVLALILTVVTGCTDLGEMDLSCRIPLSEYNDMVGSWKELVSYSDSRRTDNLLNSLFTMVRLRDFIVRKDGSTAFAAGGSTYTLDYRMGGTPIIRDAYGQPVVLTESKSSHDGDWDHSIRCSMAEVGNGISFDEQHSLSFILPESGRTCSVWTHSWISVQIKKAEGSYKDLHGNTVYYSYPYSEAKWGLTTKVGVRYYLRGQHVLTAGEVPVKLTALITDSNLDGQITEVDSAIIDPQAKGGTKGGLRNATYPLNQVILVSGRYAYKLNLVTEQGVDGPHHFLDIQRQ